MTDRTRALAKNYELAAFYQIWKSEQTAANKRQVLRLHFSFQLWLKYSSINITLSRIKVLEWRSFIPGWIKILLLPNWKLLLLTSPVIGLKCLSHLVANNLWKGPPSIFNPHIETCTHTHTHWEQEQMWPSTAPLPKSNVPGLLWSRETTGAVVKYIVKGNRWLYLQCRDSQHIQGAPSGIDCKIRGRTSFSTCSLFTSAV